MYFILHPSYFILGITPSVAPKRATSLKEGGFKGSLSEGAVAKRLRELPLSEDTTFSLRSPPFSAGIFGIVKPAFFMYNKFNHKEDEI
ncbi:MAG: hypothetical protein K6C36_02355 [Clostridia bacterium]|nr:hypothetical protein [Clostridia bacterium]